jgi:hypothetical protein
MQWPMVSSRSQRSWKPQAIVRASCLHHLQRDVKKYALATSLVIVHITSSAKTSTIARCRKAARRTASNSVIARRNAFHRVCWRCLLAPLPVLFGRRQLAWRLKECDIFDVGQNGGGSSLPKLLDRSSSGGGRLHWSLVVQRMRRAVTGVSGRRLPWRHFASHIDINPWH